MDNYFTANGALFDNEYRISVRLASCKQLRKAHLIILADTLSFNAQGKVNFKSQDRIASECGVNRGTVINAIKQLREWGLLSAKESKFKETLKLVVNYPNLMRFIQDNETVYQKAKFSPSDEETIADLKENGWIGHDVEKSNIDEDHKNHDVEKPNTRCWKTQQPMLENPTQLDHLLDHDNNTLSMGAPRKSFPKLEDIKREENKQIDNAKRAQGGLTFLELDPNTLPHWAERIRFYGLKADPLYVWGKFVYHNAAKHENQVFSVIQLENLWNKWALKEKKDESKYPSAQRSNNTGNNERKPAGDRIRENLRNKGYDV